jgi:uncharacterized protein YndB with AHSA1/START domain
MNRLNFKIIISAPAEKVWRTLWDEESYKVWTSIFSEGSYAVSDWNEGSKILFLGPDGNGLSSIIEKKTTNEYISFKHLSTVAKGKEEQESAESKKWSGAHENYILKEDNGKTTLKVELDTTNDFVDYFNEKFPEALNKVKEIAER